MVKDAEFKKLIARIEKIEKRLEKVDCLGTADKQLGTNKFGSGIKKLVKKVGVSEKKVHEIFDIEDGLLTVVRVKGLNLKEKIQNVSLLTLLGYKSFLDKNEISSQEIKRNVGENGIPLENFATYLNELIPSSIRRKGKTRSTRTMYRLTVFGESEARGVLEKLCEKD